MTKRTAEEVLASRKPRQLRVRINFDGDLADQIEALEERLRAARRRELLEGEGLSSDVPELERQLSMLRARLDEDAEEFTFQALGRARFKEILATHPPTEAQWEQHREAAKSNPFLAAPECDYEAVAPILIAECCISHDFTVEGAAKLWDELSDAEASKLFEAAWAVNQKASIRPTFGTGTDTTPSSGPGSTTPPSGESPSASSTGG